MNNGDNNDESNNKNINDIMTTRADSYGDISVMSRSVGWSKIK